MRDWYQQEIVDAGRAGVVFALIAFAVTFAITRGITRRIHARSRAHEAPVEGGGGLVKDVHIGGVHIHHQVWGILLLLTTGFLLLAYEPGTPWIEVLGALFGVGAALTLDEFALWLHLDDVYWAAEGRKSIDAVLVFLALGGLIAVGITPLGIDDAAGEGRLALAFVVAGNVLLAIVCLLKGKLVTAIFGLIIPLLSLVGAIRLAKPGSPWAQWRYRRHPQKAARAQERLVRHDARLDRVRDLLGGSAAG